MFRPASAIHAAIINQHTSRLLPIRVMRTLLRRQSLPPPRDAYGVSQAGPYMHHPPIFILDISGTTIALEGRNLNANYLVYTIN